MMRISEREIHHMNFYGCVLAATSFCESAYIKSHSLTDFPKRCVDVDIFQIILKNSAAPIRVSPKPAKLAATLTLRKHDIGCLRGRVGKLVTNGSKTAVMDVTGFLCVSLGSSTLQLHDNPGSEVHAHVQRLVSVVRMQTVLGEYTTGQQRSVVHFFFVGKKDSMQRIFIKKRFLFTVGSVCRVKRFTVGSMNSLKDFRKSQIIRDQVRKWLRQQSKDFGSRRTGKAMGHVYQCWWRVCREINVFFPSSNITCFTFYIHLWPIY
jgi:hypothetical protein